MNLDLLQAFQTAVNEYGSGDANAQVRMFRRDDNQSCFPKVVRARESSCGSSHEVRCAFSQALTSAFGVKRLEELPAEVKKELKIRDFKLSKAGEVRSSRPLTIRRIKAVLGAVKSAAASTARDHAEARLVENAFTSNFRDSKAMEAVFERIAIASGRAPMKFTVPGGKEVAVPLSDLSEYTKGIPRENLASRIEDLQDQVQRDIELGCSIYENLLSGNDCISTAESHRALRLYLSVMAKASGKAGKCRMVSVPDPNGKVAAFLKMHDPASARKLWANETVTGASDRVVFVSEMKSLGAGVAPLRQKDLEVRYRKLVSDSMASGLLKREARQGGLTVAQMLANVKAELARIATVGDEEISIEIAKERRGSAAQSLGAAEIGATKAFEKLYAFRYALSDFVAYLQCERCDLDHPEMRVGDEIVLTAEFLGKRSNAEDARQVVSPRSAQRRQPASPDGMRQTVSAPASLSASAPPASPASPDPAKLEWVAKELSLCFPGDLRRAVSSVHKCLTTGCLPQGVPPPPEFDPHQMRGNEIPAGLASYLASLDAGLVGDLVWYIKSSAVLSDDYAINLRSGTFNQDVPRPIWTALRRGTIDRGFPPELCKEMYNLFKIDDQSQDFSVRLRRRPLCAGTTLPDGAGVVEKAVSSTWGFGTCDMEKILNFVKDCGWNIDEMTPADMGRMSVIAFICDYRLDDAPTFFQRLTGKSPAEATKSDLERLFRMKISANLNDPGARFSGDAREIVDILKGDRLPSMTCATGKEVLRLVSQLRSLLDAEPNSAKRMTFLGRNVSFRLTLSGALVFTVGGFEFRAAKSPREFIGMLEDDIVGNVGKFGMQAVYRTLPQIRGAEVSSDPVEKSRSRELCLRFLKGGAGIDPSFLASVGTHEIFRIAEGVADGRYRLRSGATSQSAVRSMLERTIDRNAMTSKDAAELCDSIAGRLQGSGIDLAPMQTHPRPSRVPMKEDVRKVHEFLADLVFDADPFDFDKTRNDSSKSRVLGIMRRHVPALVAIARDPGLVATFPEEIVGDIGDLIGVGLQFLPMKYVNGVSDAELARTLNFLMDAVEMPPSGRKEAVNEFLRKGKESSAAASSAQSAKESPVTSAFGSIAGFMSGIFGSSKPSKPSGPANPAVPPPSHSFLMESAKRELLFAAIDQMSVGVADAEANIEAGVNVAMRRVQNMVVSKMGGMSMGGTDESPVWSMEFDEIVGGAMTDTGSGYGMFLSKVLSTYFTASPMVDQRRMLSSLIRHTPDGASAGAMAGALFKGAGPLLQKMLQGLPPSALGDDLSCALEDMKSNLLPIPDGYVAACMKRIVDRSAGRILSVRVERSLGAASVGQAFLCRMFTKDRPEGEECVVKLLRPTVKTAIVRERELFEAAAAEVPGMSKTFAGQLARILDELDFTIEATNVNFGRSVYEQPVYLRQNSLFSNDEIQTFNMTNLHSMEVHPLVAPTMDCLVLKKAPGETYDTYMKEQTRQLDELLHGIPVDNGKYVFADHAAALRCRKKLAEMYNGALKRQRFLIDLTMKWVHEGLFGNGFYHGDLHAGNIMTDGKGLTVIDFGNATHLTPVERGHVLRMISAALVGWSDMFETSFRSLLSAEGKAQYDAANAGGVVSRDLAEALNKGTGMDVGMRIAAALMLLQKHGIEVPGAIYNFNQCQMRLGGTVDAMNILLARISTELERLSAPVFEYGASGRDLASAEIFSAVSELTGALDAQLGNPFGGSQLKIVEDKMGDMLADFNSPANKTDGLRFRFIEELNDEEHCQRFVYPFIERLVTVKSMFPNLGPVANGERMNLPAVYAAYRKTQEHSLADRTKLAAKVYETVNELYNTAMSLHEVTLDGSTPLTFLEAVGWGISDSLYTVRTTLGNITSVKLKNEQEAEAARIERAKERMRDSDRRVAAYIATRRHERTIDDETVLAIKEIAGKMQVPFDLPGLDGSKAWLDSYPSHCKLFEAFLLNVKKLLDELERRNVFDGNTALETKKEAACIAMQYLVDRVGGLFDAFGGLENRVQQLVMVRLSEFLRSDGARRIDGRQDFERNECVMASVLYLFIGGMQPIEDE